MPKPRRPAARLLWCLLPAALPLAALLAWPHAATSAGENPPITPDAAAFFENQVRPLLADNCYSCHGKDAQLGGLRLDSRDALLKGGVSGPSLVPGDPDKSLLVTAVRQTGGLKMPQGGRLKPEQIAVLTAWVKMGAPWPASSAASPTAANGDYVISPAQRKFWSLQPVRKPTPPVVKNVAWCASPLDKFVLAKLEAKGLHPAPPADRRTLIRRATYDLTGLPPTPTEVDNFVTDKTPDAWAKVVDRLLASPRYGERQARHWLDVARYADTKGYVFNEDRAYPHAYTYRDWLIRAFNDDLPYDQFITQQLAADQLPLGDDKRPLAALGFLTVGRRFLNNTPDIMDDRIDVTMRGFEGMTVGCARCHDHKFDPIPTKDYYSLYGVFASAAESNPPISPKAISDPYLAHEKQTRDAQTELETLIRSQVTALREQLKKNAALAEPVKAGLQAVRENELPSGETLTKIEAGFEQSARDRLVVLRQTLDGLRKSEPPTPELAMGLEDRPQPVNPHVFKRGNPNNPGDAVPRRFVLALFPENQPRPEWADGGRLELARAIADPANPRTARVFVNRVWMWNFGAGLVRTPSDFGRQGERPTHPELLDYLAAAFTENNWSVKKLERMILLSSTYQQSSDTNDRCFAADPENRLLWHQNRKRLDLEEVRDTLLCAAGTLDTAKVGGPSADLWSAPFTRRRAVYGYVDRQNLPGTFRTFDFASPDATSAQRFQTTVPQQALFLMNSPLAVEQARALVARPAVQAVTDDATRIRLIYYLLYGRTPDADETALGLRFLHAPAASVAAKPIPDWQYGYGTYDEAAQRVAVFTPFAHYDDAAHHWSVSAVFPDPSLHYVSLTPDGGHPGTDAAHAVIRRWTAPASGTVTISGNLNHPNSQGDGVRARVVSSRGGLVSVWTAHNQTTPTNTTGTIAVQRGDTLDFVVDCVSSDAFDTFAWSPTVTLTPDSVGAKKVVFAAQAQFSGPPSALDKPLTHWERYAQALLMTNELMYVD